MKEINSIPSIYLEEFDIDVNSYLTYAQIQQIVNAVIKFDTWAERQQNIDLLVLYHATNIGKENIEKLGHETLLKSGLIDNVFEKIINIDKVYGAIEYTESTKRALSQILKEMPKLLDSFKKIDKKNGTSSKK